MSRFQVSKLISALVILICIQAYDAKRKDVSTKENLQSISGKQLSNGLAMNHGTNSKSRQLKKKLRAKQKKTKHNEKKTYKRKDNDRRKRKGKGKRKGDASKKLGKIRKITKLKKKKQMLPKKQSSRSSRTAPIVGDVCEFVDFFGARRMGTGCEDGSKVVISQR